jgi:hypothetical protein
VPKLASLPQRAFALLLPLFGAGCFGSTADSEPATDSSAAGAGSQDEDAAELCRRTNEYIESCGSTTYSVNCDFTSPDAACSNECRLRVSCGYYQGTSPEEGRVYSQCGDRCTCESAQRRAASCGIPVAFSCDEVCNCGYSNTCDVGIPAYAKCRELCPAWPD